IRYSPLALCQISANRKATPTRRTRLRQEVPVRKDYREGCASGRLLVGAASNNENQNPSRKNAASRCLSKSWRFSSTWFSLTKSTAATKRTATSNAPSPVRTLAHNICGVTDVTDALQASRTRIKTKVQERSR